MAESRTERVPDNFVPIRPPGRGGRMPGFPVQKPRDFRGTMRRLWSFFGTEKKSLLLIFGFVVVDALLLLAVPYMIGRAVDDMAAGRGAVLFGAVQSAIAILLAVYICDLLLTVTNNFLMAGVSQRIVKNIRKKLFAKLQRLPISFFDKRTHGDLMSRFTNDIDNISTTISNSTVSLMSDVVAIGGSFLLMLFLNPILTLASMITVPLVFLLSRTIARRTRVLFKEQQNALGRLNGHIEENISGLQVVKAFNREQEAIKEFETINDELYQVGVKAQIMSGYLMPLMNIISNLGFAVIASVGGVLAVNDMITVGVIASFLTYSKQFSRPLNEVANIFNTLQTAVAGAERIFEVLDQDEEVEDKQHAPVVLRPRGEVEFQNVNFAYPGGVPILKGISFKAKAGSTIALVGPTGAGKTTIVNLVNRFYDVTDGRILLDGTDIREFTRKSLRESFGIVLQDTYLFSGTIGENIRYGKLSATDEEVKQAAVEAGADGFIRRLKNGYDTVLSESGDNLSQGQRQLLAIARAILADRPIMILDEATSSVDTRTEMRIQRAMVKLMHGRTCFIIAHRLSTIRDADTIMVIEGGQLQEIGDHESLLAQHGFYYNLYNSQYNNVTL
ncbi:ABC transporter ATP-binding protein [Paenibacillus puldeungensis]|uniref:ABC transporter ATP-binding protein n=1 Tax=Paenibacillus puldeungensis TaxID=696536 RepID=A0ABW3RZ05_9BACL